MQYAKKIASVVLTLAMDNFRNACDFLEKQMISLPMEKWKAL